MAVVMAVETGAVETEEVAEVVTAAVTVSVEAVAMSAVAAVATAAVAVSAAARTEKTSMLMAMTNSIGTLALGSTIMMRMTEKKKI